ncbi:MAG TPA: spermidine synthase [Candidatus Nitrosotenuis sp.]|nr:spermidine synthase [Candidatus Nitrosotenuis sp.]
MDEPEGEYAVVRHRVEQVLYRARSAFQEVALVRNGLYGTFLLLDGDFQSATADEYIYHETLVHPAMLCHPGPRRVAVLGGGEGAALREVLRHGSVEEAWMVDLDAQVVEACRRHAPEYSQGAFDDPRTRLVIGDAAEFLEGFEGKLDVVVSDLTEPRPGNPAGSLFSPEFFTLVRSRLAEPGILALQASYGDPLRLSTHLAVRRALGAAFRRVRTLVAGVPTFRAEWAFATASQELDPGDLSPQEVEARLASRGVRGLRFYDGTTHARLLALPRALREAFSQP